MTRAPRPFATFRTESVHAWMRPRAEALSEELEHGRTLHQAALARDPGPSLRGRGPVPVIEAPPHEDTPAGEGWAVRHYRRGGAVAALLGDRYLRLGVPRPFRELLASEAVRARGIPTPEVVAAAVYPNGPFYRGDLVTVYQPDSAELAEILFGSPSALAVPEEDATAFRHHALVEAGHLVDRMAKAGVRHPDLNARNLLFSREGFRRGEGRRRGGSFRIDLLDLDRCQVTGRAIDARPMRHRLERSLEKLSRSSERPLGAEELALLRTSSSHGPEAT